MQIARYPQLIGLVVGFAVALLLALSQEAGGIRHGTEKGEFPYIILAHPRWWKCGLYLLCVGFVVQFLGEAR